jgi:hypothetical protein
MANIISRLGVLLGLDSAEFVRGLDAAGRKLDQFEQKINAVGKIAAAGFVAMGAKAIALADEIADVAQANDLAIASVLKLSDALQSSGGRAEDAGKVLAAFTNSIDKAAGGSFDAQKTFASLGISLQDLAKLDAQQLFDKTAQGLAAIEDPVQRNAKAFEVFGRAFKGVDVKGFNDLISQTNDLTGQQAQAIKDAADAYDVLQKSLRDLQIIFGQALGPVLLDTINYLKQTEGSSVSLGKVLTATFQAVAVVASDVGFTIKTIASDIQAIFQAINAGIKGDFAEAGRVMGAAVVRAKRERAELDAYQSKVLGIGGASAGGLPTGGGTTGGGNSGGGRTVTPGTDPKAEADRKEMQRRLLAIAMQRIRNEFASEKDNASEIGKIYVEAAEQVALAKARIASDNAANNNKFEKQNAELLALEEEDIERKKQDRLQKLRARYAAEEFQQKQEADAEASRMSAEEQSRQEQAYLSIFASQQAEKRALEFDKQRVALKGEMQFASEREYRLALARVDTEERIARIVADPSIAENRKQYLIDQESSLGRIRQELVESETLIDRIGQSWDSVFNNMASALDNFVRTGKLSFKDLARSIIADLISIEMRAQGKVLFSLMKKAVTGFSGGDLETELYGSYRASGGTVSAGSPYMVGERGPELFVPRTSGMVVPNNNLADVTGGGGQTINNYNISAIDVKSFEERILGSSRAVWAANAYAGKSLAVAQGRA